MTAASVPKPQRGWFRRFFGGLWWLLNGTRRLLLNLLLVLLVGALAWGWWASRPKALADKTTLVLTLAGPIVEQRPGNTQTSLLRRAQGDDVDVVVLRDVLETLDAAGRDPKVSAVLLKLDELQGGGLASLREIAGALQRFKATGKPVVAYGLRYSQSQFYLAAHASEVYLHPSGSIALSGYGRQRNYYADAFDKLGIKAHVLRVGQYKNFAEVFSANGPSPQTIEAEKLLFGDLWKRYTDDIEAARRLPPGTIQQLIDALPGSLKAVEGRMGQLIVQSKAVDALLTPDALEQKLLASGALDEKTKTVRQIGGAAYLARVQRAKASTGGDRIGVIVAEGGIGEGRAPAGQIGGVSTAELIRQAREDEKVKAVVLRVNSPGGSALGSELIRHELELTRQAGKPVVVSMGDVAASGGYWISMAADEVIAEPATITGSIGVVTLLPTAEALFDKLGVRAGGTSTTWLVQAYDPRTGLTPRFEQLVQTIIDDIYREFVGKAAAARKLDVAKVEPHAQGRVWTGTQAVERGLIDRTGSFADAVNAARTRAQLPEGVELRWIEREPGRLQRLLDAVGAQALPSVLAALQAGGPTQAATPWAMAARLGAEPSAGGLVQDLQLLEQQWLRSARGDITGTVHCLCTGWSHP